MATSFITVDEVLAGERLDVAVSRHVEELTRARVQKLIAEDYVQVDGKPQKANYRLRAGETVEVTVPEVKPAEIAAEKIDLDILYEDQDVLVLNKPKGLVIHPAAGHAGGTLVNALLHHCDDLSGIGGEARPGIVHRLDKDTSGVMVVAKNDRAHLSLSRQFKAHSVTREYVAIVHGEPAVEQGTIDAAIARHPKERKKMALTTAEKGRRAVTHFKVLDRFGEYSYLALRLETGRTHQIRVHLSSLGHPVVGDPVYGYKKQKFKLSGQALHARLLGFNHPTDHRYLEFAGEPPEEFRRLLNLLRGKGEAQDED
ncbi:RluA family pseudouridine synthase [Dethiobacter alkaliphilus]|uniref:Pseudouridine synthase n=1 Tax=Dethiobacter alkaliphilus AHT 1 TaxID=555088 RepID=C0GJQ1_DETAL|nr:RluA family pseudouridine synthase [Dethiobacter alkaliphilus]EEG76473.1 pseudouridine synthase, RluA family [Dethiobacter alkaliphilus AHT 1]